MNGSQPIRSFIAVSLPEGTRRALERLAQRLSHWGPGLRWIPAENVHLTLKFLGDVEPARLDRVAAGVTEAVAGVAAFDVALEGLGAFPSPRRPRVVWVGVEQGVEGLAELSRRVESAAAEEGFAPEDREFRPHLTVARARRGRKLVLDHEIEAANADPQVTGRIPGFRVQDVHVFRSELRRTGALYTRLHTAPLGAVDGGRDG